MSRASTTAHSVVEPSPLAKRVAGALVILYALMSMVPLFWIFATGFKTPPDSISYPPKIVFEPVARRLLQPLHHAHAADRRNISESLGPPQAVCDRDHARRATW